MSDPLRAKKNKTSFWTENFISKNLRDNPVIVFVGYTILIIGSTWGFFQMIYDTSKIENYKSKIEFLSSQVDQLRDENKKYLVWLQNSPGTVAYLDKRVKDLQDQNTTLLKNQAGKSVQPDSSAAEIPGKLSVIEVRKGEAYISEDGSLVIGVSWVYYDGSQARITVSYFGKQLVSDEYKNVGTTINLENGQNRGVVIIQKCDYVFDKVTFRIK